MLDFNNEAEQKAGSGPVPAGSKVMVTIKVKTPKYAIPDNPLVSQAKSGLRGLWCEFVVTGGIYDGVVWYDNLWLPAGYQTIRLSEGQTKTCNRGGAQIRAIIEAHRGISPKNTDSRSVQGRRLNDWSDLDGMEFPAKLGINSEPYIGKDGNQYWSNYITSIITPDKKDYSDLKAGREFITDGPVTGDGKAKASAPVADGNIPGWDDPPVDAYNDMPF